MRPSSVAGQALSGLIARIDQASREGTLDPELVHELLSEALSGPSDWLDPRHRQRDDSADWALHPVHRAQDGRCSILCAVFKPGVRSPVHNHGSWAVIGVYRGRERDTWFRRLDDTSVPGKARLETARTFVNPRGTVTVVPDGTIHAVEALDGREAVSIHVYGTDIVTRERSTFDLETGTEELFRPEFVGVAQEPDRSVGRVRVVAQMARAKRRWLG